MLGRKGVFLTFMVFLLIGAALALNLVLRQSSMREERTTIEESAFRGVNEAFNSIYSQIHEKREGYAGEVQKRYMVIGAPIADGTTLGISQQVPPPTTSAETGDIIDALNLFKTFLSNEEITKGLQLNIEIPDAFNSSAWNAGSDENPEVGYLIQPFCIRYLPLKSGTSNRLIGFEVPVDWRNKLAGGPECDNANDGICFEWGCKQVFDIANIERIDVNFFVGKKTATCQDYINNEPNCKGSVSSGGITCSTSYPPSAPLCGSVSCPAIDLNFVETYIEIPPQTNCFFKTPNPPPLCIRRVKGYLDPSIGENYIKLQVSSGTIIINLLDNDPSNPDRVFLMSYDGQGICLDNNVLVNIKFKGQITVDLAGFEFAASKPGFDLCRKTRWGVCPGEAAPTGCGNGTCESGEECAIDCTSETWCGDGFNNDADTYADCLDSDCYTNAACCGDDRCRPGENCPADAPNCPEPSICRLKTCTNGCNNPSAFVSFGGQDNEETNRCNDGIGCGSGGTPCACNGSGTCCSKRCNGYCAGSACYGLDPDCTPIGGLQACCGNGVCDSPAENEYNCPLDCEAGYY